MEKKTIDYSTEKVRAGGVIALTSFVILIAGIGQFQLSDPTRKFDTADDMERCLIVASVLLVFNGCIGFLVGLGASVFDFNNRSLTEFILSLMIGLSFVTFGTFVFAQPIYNFDKNIEPPVYPPGSLNREEQRSAMIFGSILPLAGFCLGTLGLEIFFTNILLLYQTENPPRYGKWSKAVMIFFAFFVGFAAIGQLIFGGLVRDEFGGDNLTSVVIQPPNFVNNPNVALVTGILWVVYSIHLFTVIINFNKIIVEGLVFMMMIQLLWLWSAFVMTNIGLSGPEATGPAVIITAVSSVMVLAPVIVAYEFLRMESHDISTIH